MRGYDTGMHGGFSPLSQPFSGFRGGGDTGISSANNSLASMLASILGNQSQNRATDAGLTGSAYGTQAGLLSNVFQNQSQLAGSQFSNLAGLLGDMYSAKSGAQASLGNAAAGRDASFQNAQAGLLGQGLQSQEGVIGHMAGLNSNLASVYGGLDGQANDQKFQMQKLSALAPLLGGLTGRATGGGFGGLPGFASNYGASASFR